MLLILLFFDPMNSASALLLAVASFMYILVLHDNDLFIRGTTEVVNDLHDGRLVLLAGACAAFIFVKGHRELSRGVLDWNRRIVRLALAALISGVTALVTADYLLTGEVGGVLLNLIPPVMFLYVMAHALVEKVHRSIVVLGPRRNGNTTFLVGLYHAYLETDEETDSGGLSSLISRVREHSLETLARWFGDDAIDRMSSSLVGRAYTGLRSLVARLRETQFVIKRPIATPVKPTHPLSEMWSALNDENEDGWGTYELDRPLELGKSLPEPMYVKLGFEVVSKRLFIRRVRLQTVDSSGDHYDDLPDLIDEYRGLSGWVRRYLARALGTDLDEYGEYEDERRFERVFARKIVSADAIVLVLEADHLADEDEIPDGSDLKVSTREYNRKMRPVLERLEETGPSRDVILVVTKVDRLLNRPGEIPTTDLEETVREALDENNQLAELRNTVEDFSAIHAVCFEMKDDESGPVKPPEITGFRATLRSLVPAYE